MKTFARQYKQTNSKIQYTHVTFCPEKIAGATKIQQYASNASLAENQVLETRHGCINI